MEKHIKYPAIEINGTAKSWEELTAYCDNDSSTLQNVFSRKSGLRIGTLIDKFIFYNISLLRENRLTFFESALLAGKIPRLYIDPGTSYIIDYIWKNITSPNYAKPLIKNAADEQVVKIRQLFNLLSNIDLNEGNGAIKQFYASINNRRFEPFSNKWKVCFLIAHLSWDEVNSLLEDFEKGYSSINWDIGGDAAYSDRSVSYR